MNDTMRQISVRALAQQAVDLMLEAGFKPASAWYEYECVFQPIVRMHSESGLEYYSGEVTEQFVQHAQKRYDNGEIAYTTYRHMLRGARKLAEVYATGTIEWSRSAISSRLNKYYDGLLEELLQQKDWSKRYATDSWGYWRRYCVWLQQEGHKTFDTVNVVVIQKYLLECSQRMTGHSLGLVKGKIKKLHLYLAETGVAKESFEDYLSFPVSKEHKIIPPVPTEEIVAMLNAIDKTKQHGERDYAIMLLGVVTGIRAIDVANLKLTDIDWRRGEIRITQQKTGQPLAVPLTNDVGNALRNYILNSRLNAASEYVFHPVVRPLKGHITSEGVSYIYESCREKAGLPRRKGQRFHSLRRTAGLNMVTNGVPLTTVSQVLGHSDVESTKQYISLDSKHLKECALGFNGIEPMGVQHEE